MGVRILVGVADGTSEAAAMYDSVTGWMLGPIWEADDAYDQIEKFQDWLRSHSVFELSGGDAGVGRLDLFDPGQDGTDVRSWKDGGLEKLVVYWRRAFAPDGHLPE